MTRKAPTPSASRHECKVGTVTDLPTSLSMYVRLLKGQSMTMEWPFPAKRGLVQDVHLYSTLCGLSLRYLAWLRRVSLLTLKQFIVARFNF